jgi:hypothetical protein
MVSKKNTQIQLFVKIRQVGAESLRADRHDEPRFLILQMRPKVERPYNEIIFCVSLLIVYKLSWQNIRRWLQ